MEAKVDAKRLALEEGVHEDEPELFLEVEKKNGKSFVRQLWPKDQKERDPVRHEAILLLMRLTKEDLA